MRRLRLPVFVSSLTLVVGAVMLAAGADDALPVRLLPMGMLPAASVKVASNGMTTDAPLRSYRVGRESRTGRAVQGPHRIERTVVADGGRFETAFAPMGTRRRCRC